MAVKADITIDIDKQVGELQNLTQIYNARVGDNKTPLTIAWRKNDLPLNLKGLHAYIVGKTGDGSYNSETGKIDFPVNTPVSQFEDDGSGTLDGGQSGLTTLLIPKQMWQNSGLFAGYIGLKSEDGSVFTSKDIWFKVLGNVLDAGVEINYFIGDFDKALSEAEKKLQDKADSFDQATANALQDLHDKYLQKVQEAEDSFNKSQSAIDDDLASLKKLAASVGALQAQLDANNLETVAQHQADIQNLKTDLDYKFANIKHPVQAFDSLTQLQAKYPNGADGDFVTTDSGHIYIYSWLTNSWKDCGIYQSQGISDNSINADKLKNFSQYYSSYIEPLIVNFDNHTLKITDGYHFLFKGREQIALPTCILKIMLPDEKDKTKMSFPTNGVIITFKPLNTPEAAKAPEQQFKIYDFNRDGDYNPACIPDDEFYIGWIDFATKKFNFIFPAIEKNQVPMDGNIDNAILIKRKKLPTIADELITQHPVKIDFDKPSITLMPGYNRFQHGALAFTIESKEFQLQSTKPGATSYFLFLKENKDNPFYSIKSVSTLEELPENALYIGWIETMWKQYKLINSNKAITDVNSRIISPNLFTVNWDEMTLNNQMIWRWGSPYQDNWIGTQKVNVSIKTNDEKESTKDAYYVAINKNNISNDNDINKNIMFYHSITDIPALQNYIGWIDPSSKTFDLGNYGSSNLSAAFPWANKNVTCLGDSITWGMQEGNFGRTVSYAHQLPDLLHANVSEKGWNASSIGDSDDSVPSFVDRVDDIKDQDLVTVLGGTNDFGRNQPLGSMQNNEEDTKTFYGALKYLIIHITNNNPNARVLFMTPPKLRDNVYVHTYDDEGNPVKNTAGFSQLDYVNAIRKVCSYYSIPVLDLFNDGPYNPFIPSQRSKYTNDGLHPNQDGQDLLAQTISKKINSL